MTRHLLVLLAGLTLLVQGAERRARFTGDWRFLKGDAAGAEAPDFNDSAWRAVTLPHDWAIEGPFDPKWDSHLGGLPISGTGWYRKRFTLPAAAKDRHWRIEFDGVMSNSTVWLNGQKLGSRPYGYISFGYDLAPHLRSGENVLAVKAAPEEFSSRWYPGAGIYRNVWLVETGVVRVAPWGVYVTAPEVTAERATVALRVEMENLGTTGSAVTMEVTIENAAGAVATRATENASVPAGGKVAQEAKLTVTKPARWDVDSPTLYRAVVSLKTGGREIDRVATPFGIRTIAFDRGKGFVLNGRGLKMRGVCMHHDLGALGAAVNRRATQRQLQIMKGMGVNAIRTSHNPPSPEVLEFCDRLGLVVMDEAFDMWRIPKVRNGYAKYWDECGERDLRDFLRRDRNHPSIVLWSIGNEIPEQGRPDGAKLARRLTDICHEEDPSRLVTAGFNVYPGAIRNGLADAVDIPGFNYKPMFYDDVLREHPKWIIVGAESASTVSSRGVYHLPLEKYQKHPSLQVSSYDIIAPPWAMAADVELDAQERLPGVLGEFIWTGFDYLGEPTPFENRDRRNASAPLNPDWPSRSSYFGVVDLAGFPKDRYYLYKSVWSREDVLHLLPHWNWAGKEGRTIPVMAYTNAGEVELFLNGKSLGVRRRGVDTVVIPVGPNVSKDLKFTTKYRLMWEVPYAPGVLKAVGKRNGKTIAAEVRTAGAAARLRLEADRATIEAGGEDLSFVTVRVEDAAGNLCPLAEDQIRFKVSGAGEIAAVDNGNAATVEPFQADRRKAFSGMALVIVRGARGKRGLVELRASAAGLSPASVRLQVR